MLHSTCQQAVHLHVHIYNGVKQLLQFYYMLCTCCLCRTKNLWNV